MNRYEQYKNSEIEWIGEIPSHWDSKRLKYVALVQPSNVDKKVVDGETTVLLCNYMDVYKNEFIDDSINFMEATATESEIIKFKIKQDDVLVTKDSETADDIANPALVKTDFENAICGYHLTQIRPNRDELIGEYLFRLFQGNRYKGQFEVAANGVTRFGLSVSSFSDAFVPLPTVEEQTSIAYFLDDKTAQIDTLIANKQKLIELLKEERTAIINQAVTKGINPKAKLKPSGIEWLGDVPEHWQVKKLKYISPKVMVGLVINPSSYYDVNGTIPMLTGKNVSPYRINVESTNLITTESNEALYKTKLREGDIVVVRVGYPGVAAVVKGEIVGANCASMVIVRKGEFDSDFLCFCFNSDIGKSQVEIVEYGAAQKQFNISHSIEFLFPVPPINEQALISKHIEISTQKIDVTISKIEKEIDLLQEYRTALISEVITGKVKVAA